MRKLTQCDVCHTLLTVVAGATLVVLAGCNSGSGYAQPDNVATNNFSVGGTISGLTAASLSLELNGGNALTASNGKFVFTTKVSPNSSYVVTIPSQPTGQICTISNGTATSISAAVTNVQVICSADTYSIGGSITGLTSGNQITLTDNNSGPAIITANNGFTLPEKVAYDSGYSVSIKQQPVGQNCTVSDGTGSQVTAAVSTVAVTCTAPGYTVLYNFGSGTNASGAYNAALVQGTDGNFYGASYLGGANGVGSIFKVTPAGIETVIYSFTVSGLTDGQYPYGTGVTFGPDGALYGTAYDGGSTDCGTIYRVTTAGSFSVLYDFTGGGTDGCYPEGGLTLGTDGNFYGTTSSGAANNHGTAFKISPAGSYTQLHAFGAGSDVYYVSFSNLTQAPNGIFYGVGYEGGANGYGGVFSLTSSGTEAVLYSFTGGNDGGQPGSTLTLGADGELYGTTDADGANSDGTAFKISTNGTFTLLHAFAGGANDGANPYSNPLVLGSDGNFYGMTNNGGANNVGVLFKMTASGTVTVLHSFNNGTSDGGTPFDSITLGADGYIYGTTTSFGLYGGGVFFRY